jgi:hypothetical protein
LPESPKFDAGLVLNLGDSGNRPRITWLILFL